jgi:lipopolysaccharide/colanic/teichoic acid biosynthesis glycosyltransferase
MVAKRLMDVMGGLAGLTLLSPVLVLIAAAIRLDTPGSPLHRAQRVGLGGRLFTCYKFRTMKVGAAAEGSRITAARDPRITRVGRFLRRSKLDELPQLINVLRGEMSLVGPRPEDPHYVALYSSEQRRVLSVRPGITSAASIRFRDEEQILTGDDWERRYREIIMPGKLSLDLEYAQRQPDLREDLRILLLTMKAVFHP